MTFADYYNGRFRNDLATVIAAVPPAHEHASGEVTLQPRFLSRSNPVIHRWSEEQRMLFASALLLTVLADQVCYTHFHDVYGRFRELTAYPKWRGDCPGGCAYHIEPAVILRAIGAAEGRLATIDDLPLHAFPDDLFQTMRSEVADFFERHLPNVDGDDFWQRCDAEIPTHFKLLYLASRNGTV